MMVGCVKVEESNGCNLIWFLLRRSLLKTRKGTKRVSVALFAITKLKQHHFIKSLGFSVRLNQVVSIEALKQTLSLPNH